MICGSCGAEVDNNLILCPHCGQALQRKQLVAPAPQPEVHREIVPVRSAANPAQVIVRADHQTPRRAHRGIGLSPWVWVLLLFMLISCVGVAFVAAAVGGVYQGLRERDQLNQVASRQHYNRGLEHLQLQERELALAEFEEAMRLDPRFVEAYERLKELKVKATVQPTPTSAVVEQAVDEIYQDAEAARVAGQFDEAIAKLEQIQSLDPAFRPGEVADLLYDIQIQKANVLLDNNSLEEARRSFDSALALRPDDSEVSEQAELIDAYISAAGLLGANWDEALAQLTELYESHPDFLDLGSRLYQAHIDYADWLAQKESWCDAADQYTQALELQANSELQDRQTEMADNCRTNPPTATPEGATDSADLVAASTASAGPQNLTAPAPTTESTEATATPKPTKSAPAPTPTSTDAAEPTTAGTEPAPPTEGAPAAVAVSGMIAYSAYDEDQVRRIYQVNAAGGGPEILLKDGSQPAFSRDGAHVAFHSLLPDAGGIRIVDAGGRNGTNVTKFAEDGYPSWSPDGTQIAFASTRESDRRPRIFTGWAGGLADGTALTLGDSPAWSVTGVIAYHGCDRSGGSCGIWGIAPNGGNLSPLTSHESDNAPSWSADGSALAFMSARDGNWEIYRAGSDGSNPTRLTTDGANDGLPVWSPDGSSVAWVSDRGGGWGLWVMAADGSGPRKLADIPNIGRDWLQQRLSWKP